MKRILFLTLLFLLVYFFAACNQSNLIDTNKLVAQLTPEQKFEVVTKLAEDQPTLIKYIEKLKVVHRNDYLVPALFIVIGLGVFLVFNGMPKLGVAGIAGAGASLYAYSIWQTIQENTKLAYVITIGGLALFILFFIYSFYVQKGFAVARNGTPAWVTWFKNLFSREKK